MSIQLGKLCSVIIEEHFGEKARIVCEDLYASVAKNLPMIVVSTKLPKSEVTYALAILIKFRLVKFAPSSREHMAEYSVDFEKILLILRYGRYVHLIQTKFDNIAASLTDELLRAGTQTASNCILKTLANADVKDKYTLVEVKDKFHDLVQRNYFIRGPHLTSTEEAASVPVLEYSSSVLFEMPEIPLKELIDTQQGKETKLSDYNIFWMVNMDKFHLDFRDSVMLSAITRQLDVNAAECLKFILQIMYTKTEPWQIYSNPISTVEIRQLCEKRSTNRELIKYLDQYLSIIESGTTKYITKTEDMGGGQYIIHMLKLFEQLTWCCIENIIVEKFGSKAARIFRVIRFKKYIQQEDIQKEAMVPSREAKQLTYRLMEENFVKVQVIRKANVSTTGPANLYSLFYINLDQIVAMLLETCYKALYNAITRSSYDKSVNRRLIDKFQRMESVVETMRERGEDEEYIADILDTMTPPEKEILQKVKLRVKSLFSAEIGLDETIFLLKLYQYYKSLTLK